MNEGPDAKPGMDRSPSYLRGGILPTPMFERRRNEYPLLRYPWQEVKAALLALAANQPPSEPVQVAYVNPETGQDCQRVLGFSALMLRPGQTLDLPARSASSVLHVIEGAARVKVGEEDFSLAAADTCCAPGYTALTLQNLSASEPAWLFMADDAPFQKKLGVYEVRA
jgi:gentisate 1,2-dioxygenase